MSTQQTGTERTEEALDERSVEVLRAVAEHGYLGEELPLAVVGVGGCGVCTGHSPSWDGHDYGCHVWVRSKLRPLLAELDDTRAQLEELRKPPASDDLSELIARIEAENPQMKLDRYVVARMFDYEARAERAEAAIRDALDVMPSVVQAAEVLRAALAVEPSGPEPTASSPEATA